MIPGPYSICHATLPDDDSDGMVYRTLKWGYDSARHAHGELAKVAREAQVSEGDCCVIRHIDIEEADRFGD